jgi:hypothetical protein
LFDALDALGASCQHARSTVSPTHHRAAVGSACNHVETCDECGAIIATESWNLALGTAAHAAAYPTLAGDRE